METDMTHEAKMNWSGNWTYRGYQVNKNGRIWDVYAGTFSQGRATYGWTKKEAMKKIDNIIDRGCKWKDE